MTSEQLRLFYRDYIACLNGQDWHRLDRYVHEEAQHNGRAFGLSGYLDMLRSDFRAIPDLVFNIDLLMCEPPRIAARLCFDCTPVGTFLGLDIGGRRIRFTENVFYEVRNERIASVWSIVDKAGIEAQL
ncbi:ester cyclase [Aureimonas sp. Leaf454]|uniref:ester cyclase n=1 Tax=Aureimonas sp. Leaf454 TaxID=1736381 RepID=UPI000701CC02|nr:ester cyclase [Aureimonas sp. Leaf454]KQT45280.1 ester cyclase [Aureimonas sp. Leaf454]